MRYIVTFILALACLTAGAHEQGGINTLSLEEIKALSGPSTPTKKKPRPGLVGIQADVTPLAVSIDPKRSLIDTDTAIVPAFPIIDVLNRIAQGSPNSMIARQIYDQWMDLNNKGPGIGQGPHCDDVLTNGLPAINGFAIDCARAEGRLVGTNPTNGSPDSFRAIAVVNRFDLATDPRQGGTDCGEYRIIYAKNSGMTVATDRMQIIFEAVLPNPKPNGVDLSGCKPVVQFWADLTNVADPAQRAASLRTFFFTGLPGFEPVVKAAHYGFATTKAPGQIRTNQFMQQAWVLREYRIEQFNGRLRTVMAPAHLQLAGPLFNENDPNAKGPAFRTEFLNEIATLAVQDVNGISMKLRPNFFAADGDQQHPIKSNLPANLALSPNFANSIQQKLTSIGSKLTPTDIANRAMSQTCAGCHQLSSGKPLGDGVVWPASLGFVHVSEALRDAAPERFRTSPALNDVFLPRRKAVMEAFLN